MVKGGFTLGSTTKETLNLSNMFGGGKSYRPKEFALMYGFKVWKMKAY